MKDSSFGMKQYKQKLKYIQTNEQLLRSTDGIKQLSESLGYQTEDLKQGLLSLDPVSPKLRAKSRIFKT